MIYFIAEDSNSAHVFWRKVLDIFCGNYIEIDKNMDGKKAYSNTQLDNKVDVALQIAQANDTVFVAFDNIGSPLTLGKNVFDSADFIQNTMAKCQSKGVGLLLSEYYCFEEVYTTYNELERLCRISNKKNARDIADVLKYVNECIENNVEYYDKNNKHVQFIINIKNDAAFNKEHFADALLTHATMSIQYGFFTTTKEKGGLGKCWINSCNRMREAKNRNSANLIYNCRMCQFKMKDASDKQKLLDLNNHSILKYANTNFEHISDYT